MSGIRQGAYVILSGHPSGNPNSHQAFRAFAEAGLLYGICIPWLPSALSIKTLSKLPFLRSKALRLGRRQLDLAGDVGIFQGRSGEFCRLAVRAFGLGSEKLSYQANDWLMEKMSHHTNDKEVTAIHSYEDCSILQFRQAKGLGKACIYDMPIGYYAAWQRQHVELAKRFSDWIAAGDKVSSSYARPEQKQAEMSLADAVIAPSDFVAATIHEWFPDKTVFIARYGIETEFWYPRKSRLNRRLTFIYAGQCSVRKGVPLLIEAWRAAALTDAQLLLVGGWHLNKDRMQALPDNVHWSGPVGHLALREAFWGADCFIAPTFFEGRSLVIGEAMATGLPVITTPSSGCADLVGSGCGAIFPTGNLDALVEALRGVCLSRDCLSEQRAEARRRAESATWNSYRTALTNAVERFI